MRPSTTFARPRSRRRPLLSLVLVTAVAVGCRDVTPTAPERIGSDLERERLCDSDGSDRQRCTCTMEVRKASGATAGPIRWSLSPRATNSPDRRCLGAMSTGSVRGTLDADGGHLPREGEPADDPTLLATDGDRDGLARGDQASRD
jgi:hypothetical protein